MKTIFIHLGRILLGTILLLLIWMISMSIAEYFIPSHLQVSEAPEGLLFSRFLLVCLIHVILLYVTIRLSVWSGVRLMLTVFLLIFMIQYFLSMIEAVWFNESLNMPVSGISSLLLSGFLLSLFFTPLMVWIGGKTGKPGKREKPGMLHVEKNQQNIPRTDFFDRDLIWKIAFLVLIVYPALYFLAGYYIAWQSEPVRMFYTGSSEMESFGKMMAANIKSGLYGFQILRGLIWAGLAIPLYLMLEGSCWFKAVMTGLLFALLMNAQHLLPNPYFPQEVSKVHFIETASSNFLWGFIIILLLHHFRFLKKTAGRRGGRAASERIPAGEVHS